MPHFHAPLSKHCQVRGELFVLDVALPASDLLRAAWVCLNVRDSYISPTLADRFGLGRDGGTLTVRIRQHNHFSLRWHEFDPIEVQFRRAHNDDDPAFVGLGIELLSDYFGLSRCDPPPDHPSPAFLFLYPLEPYREWCKLEQSSTAD
jgi:hypothetical protein